MYSAQFRTRSHVWNVIVRYLSNIQGVAPTPELLHQLYNEKKTTLYKQYEGRTVNSRAVFTNAEFSLKHITVYGFDYDFTLVQYTPDVMELIYDKTKTKLVEDLRYPSHIQSLNYDPNFATRGLHLDIRNGLLMKMDAYHHIQMGSVYRGHAPVNSQEVIQLYRGTHVPLYIMDDHLHRRDLDGRQNRHHIQFLDTFSIPEIGLFADISEYFLQHNIPFDPEYLYLDVENSIKEVHNSGIIHAAIVNDPDRYMEIKPGIPELLSRLKSAEKKLFLLTNSPFWFVNHGMRHMTKSVDWRDLFDIIICSARKPKFYSDVIRPFRSINPVTLAPTWERVTQLQPGNVAVYHQGNIKEFIKLTGWNGSHVLYIGDHVLSDLSDPSLNLGWKTGAIIPELDAEIKKGNSSKYKQGLASLLALDNLLNEHQGYQDTELINVIEQWRKERKGLRRYLKELYNPYFGSIFRTEKGQTYFSRRLMRFASLYMSSLDNLRDISLDHTFYTRRASLPHEPDINFDI